MNEEIFEKIKAFTLDKWFQTDTPWTRETRIEEDLGINGGDGVDFILAYGKHFKVDISNFMAADYFEPEGMNLITPRTIPNKKTLTLGHLEKGVIAGRLDETVINSK